MNMDVWTKFGPYSCTLNIEVTWQELANKIEVPVEEVKSSS